MRKFAISGFVISLAYLATTVAGSEVVPQTQSGRSTRMVGDPIVIGDCRVGVINKQDVPSHRSGQLKWLAVSELEKQSDGSYRYLDEAKRNEAVPANRDVLVVQVDVLPGQEAPANRKLFTEKNGGMGDRRYYERYYLQLIEGDDVERNQKIGQLDDRLVRAEYLSKQAKAKASVADVEAAEKTEAEAKERWNTAQRLYPNAISGEDYRAARVTYERYKSEHTSKRQMVVVAQEEQNQARTVLELHEIRAAFRGQVKAIYKHPGEAVRELEPVLQIQSLEKLRVDGLVDVQYRDRIRKGMKAVIEAPLRREPLTLKGHLQEVTSVAAAHHQDRPLVVSASEDGTVRVWDLKANPPEVHSYPHPRGVAFRAVACSPASAGGNYCLAGDAEGVVWLYDLSNRSSKDPVRKMEGGHQRAVTMVGFNPDGKLCISASEDRPRGSICIWETATGEQKRYLPSLHGGAITSVQFTAGNCIVSAARDNTLRYWTPGSGNKYESALSLPRRSGDLTHVGVSPDGKLVLFDQGRELRLLSLPEGKYVGALSSPSSTNPFTTMALFSPDGKLVLTTGAAEGRLQLWSVPVNGKRGRELVHLIPPDRSLPTCGAFAPNGEFVVTGTRDRLVQVWYIPSKEELEEDLVATVMNIDPALETGGRQMRIRADIANPKGRLILSDTVTMVIYPQ